MEMKKTEIYPTINKKKWPEKMIKKKGDVWRLNKEKEKKIVVD